MFSQAEISVIEKSLHRFIDSEKMIDEHEKVLYDSPYTEEYIIQEGIQRKKDIAIAAELIKKAKLSKIDFMNEYWEFYSKKPEKQYKRNPKPKPESFKLVYRIGGNIIEELKESKQYALLVYLKKQNISNGRYKEEELSIIPKY